MEQFLFQSLQSNKYPLLKLGQNFWVSKKLGEGQSFLANEIQTNLERWSKTRGNREIIVQFKRSERSEFDNLADCWKAARGTANALRK